MIKLHLGCGIRNFGPEWVHIDGNNFPHIHSHDVTDLPFDDESVDLIYASHLLEYFDYTEGVDVLKEWCRVLKPGGVLRIAVPNFSIMAALYIDGKLPLERFIGPLYGKMQMNDEWIYHRTCYDWDTLMKALLLAGFTTVSQYDWRATEHASFDDHSQAYIPHMDKKKGVLISLNVEAIK